jgi:DNA-binding protein H-NS
MTSNELWDLRAQLDHALRIKLESEKQRLDARLKELELPPPISRRRDRYRRVRPKFYNPANPSQTWAGRGKTPRWISELLASGKSIDELRFGELA